MSKSRDEYTWTDCAQDLALMTPLTLLEAGQVTGFLSDLKAHPYDVLSGLILVFGSGNIGERARGLFGLMAGSEECRT